MKTVLWSSNNGDVPADLAFINKYDATVDPGVNDDSTHGYRVGSVWVNTTSKASFTLVDATAGAAVWEANGQVAPGDLTFFKQGAPAAKTVSGLLTAADLLKGIITVLQGAGATSAQQLPAASDIIAAMPANFDIDDAFDVSIMNISVTGAEDVTVTTNTGLTLVGSMDFPAHDAATVPSCGILRFRKTAAATMSVYRVG